MVNFNAYLQGVDNLSNNYSEALNAQIYEVSGNVNAFMELSYLKLIQKQTVRNQTCNVSLMDILLVRIVLRLIRMDYKPVAKVLIALNNDYYTLEHHVFLVLFEKQRCNLFISKEGQINFKLSNSVTPNNYIQMDLNSIMSEILSQIDSGKQIVNDKEAVLLSVIRDEKPLKVTVKLDAGKLKTLEVTTNYDKNIIHELIRSEANQDFYVKERGGVIKHVEQTKIIQL